jgi:asparagine synthase (glutamine-hydrolysing)
VSEIDPRALFSLLQFGFVAPPLSPWKCIHRVPPGFCTTIHKGEESISEPLGAGDVLEELSNPSLSRQVEIITRALDAAILAACSDGRAPVILFSGGVDSSLLAARTAALGLRDATLVNFSFGENDKESQHAEAVARCLDLPFIRIYDTDSKRDLLQILADAGRIYPYPFCDPSTLPMYSLVRFVANMFPPGTAVLDGTGADALFGLFSKAIVWRRITRIPLPMLLAIGSLYRIGPLRDNPSPIEYGVRLLRRAGQMQFPASALAQNPLAGIAYDQRHSQEVSALLTRSPLHAPAVNDWRAVLAASDVSWVAAGIFAQKSTGPLLRSKFRPVFPFLSRGMVETALHFAWQWSGSLAPKWVLKEALSRHLPPALIYRPKSGFTPNLSRQMRSPEFSETLDEILGDRSPVSGVVNSAVVRRLCRMAAAGEKLPPQTYNFLWGSAFTSRWFSTALNPSLDVNSVSPLSR